LTTVEGDLVLDPFAGSNTTGQVAERLKRRWIAFEMEGKYREGSKFKFWPVADDTAKRLEKGQRSFLPAVNATET
jgi:DNA modification methylase